jgi:hypothetical protein
LLSTGSDAIELASVHNIDLVFLDRHGNRSPASGKQG